MRNILLLLFVLFLFACDDDEKTSVEISYPVEYTLMPSENNSLRPILSYITITDKVNNQDKLGCGGLLVVNSLNGIAAFDLSCPVEWNNAVKMSIDDDLQCKCNKCGALFDVTNGEGNPILGTNLSLKKYKITDGYKITN